MTAGELLRTVRRRHGLTQKQLAIRARTSQAAISRIERGLVSPTVEMLERLLDLMGEELRLDADPMDIGFDMVAVEESLSLSDEQRLTWHARSANNLRRFVEDVRRAS